MSTTPKTQEHPIFEWPRWATAYALIIGGPMIIIALGLAAWVVWTYQDLALSGESIGFTLLFLAFVLSFVMAGVLFYYSIARVFSHQSEALDFAALAHLMCLGPAVTLLFLKFFRQQELFLGEFNAALRQGQITTDMLMLAWALIHIYLALFLALADNTSRFVNPE